MSSAINRVLFVCSGNICRSPMAEGLFRKLLTDGGMLDRFEIDSAATGRWHIGEAPDARAIAVRLISPIDPKHTPDAPGPR